MKDEEKIRAQLRKQKYGLVGRHSAVQICHWTKNSLRGDRGCWKEKFYGIKSHRCCQATVSLFNCENKCVHCWRETENSISGEVKNPEEPEKIIEELFKERKKLLMGFGGNKKTSGKKFKEALLPSLFTFSLTGEATLYPRLDEMIKILRNKKLITFLVSNGQNPKMLLKLKKNNSLPTQLTISLNAPNKKLFEQWHCSNKKNAWKNFKESMKIMKSLKGKCRRCVRLTLVKKGREGYKDLNGLTNMDEKFVEQYSRFIEMAQPDFVHVKGFTSIGHSRERMGYDKMPMFDDVKEYAKNILASLQRKNKKWKILGKDKRSCVVVIGKNKNAMKIKSV